MHPSHIYLLFQCRLARAHAKRASERNYICLLYSICSCKQSRESLGRAAWQLSLITFNRHSESGRYLAGSLPIIISRKESQGIEYIDIPVDFKQPRPSDFSRFSEALDRVREKKVHAHCAANYRVSAFYSLYLVSRGLWSAEQAMEFIRSVWQPRQPTEHPAWSDFITVVLAAVSAQQSVPADRRKNA